MQIFIYERVALELYFFNENIFNRGLPSKSVNLLTPAITSLNPLTRI
jgi:hypothetical protein